MYDEIRDGGNFADDLRQNPEMLGLPDELKEETLLAMANTMHLQVQLKTTQANYS